jgi:hypothetical protein
MAQNTIITRRKFLQSCGLETTGLMLAHRSGEYFVVLQTPIGRDIQKLAVLK